MSKKQYVIIAVTLMIGLICAKNTAAAEKWARLEFKNREVSVAFPPGYLVDAEKHSDEQLLKIFAYQNGVTIEFQVLRVVSGRDRLKLINPTGSEKGFGFKIKDVSGKQMVSDTASGFAERIFLASGDRLYSITVSSPERSRESLRRFNYAIEVAGEPLFERKPQIDLSETVVQAADLKTSDMVKEAFSRKPASNKVNIEYNDMSAFVPPPAVSGSLLSSVIVEKPHLDLRSMYPFGPGVPPPNMSAKMVIQFSADGQVGDVKVYSSSGKAFAKACAEAAKKIKFVPARDGGTFVDSVSVVDYDVIMAAVTTMGVGPVLRK